MTEFIYQKDISSFLMKNPFAAYIYDPPTTEHSHDYFEFSFGVKNKCKCEINGVKFDFAYGTCTIVRPTDKHTYKNLPKCKFGEYQHADIYVDKDKMKSICDVLSENTYDKIISSPSPIVFSLPSSTMQTITNQMDLFLSLDKTSELCNVIHTSIATLLISKYCEESFFFSAGSKQPEWINRLTLKLASPDYMLLPVSKIAKDLGYSPEYISREFHKYMKTTLNKYIIRKKMEYAATIIATNDIKIINLAQMLGYSNPSNFSKNFKDCFNYNPYQYQQMVRKKTHDKV